MLKYIKLRLEESDIPSDSLSEEYSPDKDMPEYAVLSDDGQQIGCWMKCKDYIQDTVWGMKNEKSCEVYGFNYRHGVDPLPGKTNINLALRWIGKSEEEMSRMLINTKKVVEDMEKRLGVPKFKRTRFSKVNGCHFTLRASSFWMKSSQLVSFFTFMVRSSLLNKTGRLETSKDTAPVKKDIYYLLSGKDFIKKILTEGPDFVDPNWDSDNAYDVHNGGFVNYSKSVLKSKSFSVGSQVQDDDWEF